MLSRATQGKLALYFCCMIALHGDVLWKARHSIVHGYPDFAAFYSGGSIVRQGLGKQLYDEPTQYRAQQQFAAEVSIRQGPLLYTHPPFEALLFVPFTAVSYFTAYVLWDLANLLFLLTLFYLLRTSVPWLRQVPAIFWLLGCLAFFPVFFALLHGQDTILLALLVTAVYVLLRRQRDIAAGFCLGLCVFRFHLVVPLILILLYQKRIRTMFGFVPTAAALGLISVLIVGWRGALDYPRYVWHLEPARTIVSSGMANVRGLLDPVLIPLTSKLATDIVISIMSLALIFFAARTWRPENPAEFDLGFALCMIVAVLVGYHTLAHDLTLLLLPITFTVQHLCGSVDTDRRTRALLLIPLGLLLFSPLHALLALRSGPYNLFAWVLLFWGWVLSREINPSHQKELGRERFHSGSTMAFGWFHRFQGRASSTANIGK